MLPVKLLRGVGVFELFLLREFSRLWDFFLSVRKCRVSSRSLVEFVPFCWFR